jgi:hypothetical protein
MPGAQLEEEGPGHTKRGATSLFIQVPRESNSQKSTRRILHRPGPMRRELAVCPFYGGAPAYGDNLFELAALGAHLGRFVL